MLSNKRDILKADFLAIISHFHDIFTKGGEKGIKVGTISKEEVKYYQKVTSCGKIFLKEHYFFLR